jgi:hypothetical protein
MPKERAVFLWRWVSGLLCGRKGHEDVIVSLASSLQSHLFEPCKYRLAQAQRLDFSALMSRNTWYLTDYILKSSTLQKFPGPPTAGRALSQFPVCCVSNTILLTVIYKHKHDCTHDWAEMRPAVHRPSLSTVIQYVCVYCTAHMLQNGYNICHPSCIYAKYASSRTL